jgi:hypothetical protein
MVPTSSQSSSSKMRIMGSLAGTAQPRSQRENLEMRAISYYLYLLHSDAEFNGFYKAFQFRMFVGIHV